MKYFIQLLFLTLSATGLSQTKKETIDILQSKIDSLSKEVIKAKSEFNSQSDKYNQLIEQNNSLELKFQNQETLLRKLGYPNQLTSDLYKGLSIELKQTKADSTIQKIVNINHTNPFTFSLYSKNRKDFFVSPEKSWEMCEEVQYRYNFTYDSLLYLVEIIPSCSAPEDFMIEVYFDYSGNSVFMKYETTNLHFHSETGGGRDEDEFTFAFDGSFNLVNTVHLYKNTEWFDEGVDSEKGAKILLNETVSTCGEKNHEHEEFEFDYGIVTTSLNFYSSREYFLTCFQKRINN